MRSLAQYLESQRKRHLNQLLELLRIPSVSTDPDRRPDVKQAADWVRRRLIEAGCSRATLYAHFRNKEDLYGSLLQWDAEGFIRETEAILHSEGGAPRKIRRVVNLARRTYARNHVLRLALAGDAEMTLESVAHAFTREQEQRTVALLRLLLEEGIEEGVFRDIDPERVAYLMFHLGRFLVERETSGLGDYGFDEIISVMDDIFSRGVTAARPSG